MPNIRLHRVSKKLNSGVSLHEINLEIPDRKLFCILGPAGSGKSTLMRLLAGLDTPDSGAIFFNDVDVTRLGPRERKVSVVFQDFALYPHMTVFENIASPLRAAKISAAEIKNRVANAAELLRISHRLDHYPAELSGGEKQRVAIARAIVKDVDVVLLDEPLTRLDYKIREDMRAEFRRLHERFGKTIILITSDPSDAMSLGDLIAVMSTGRVVQTGSLSELYNSPNDIFVAKYLGVTEMNILEGTLLRKDGKNYLKSNIFEATISGEISDQEVRIGLRPEQVQITELGRPKEIKVNGKVVLCEVIGSDTVVHVDVGTNELFRVLVPAIYRRTGEVTLSFDKKDLYLFSTDGKFIQRGS